MADTTPTRNDPLPQPQHLMYLAKHIKQRPMAYGYVIHWRVAKARGEALWDTPEARQSLARSVELSYIKHMAALCRAYWPRVHLEPVKFDGMIFSCITLADTVGSWNSAGDEKPPQEVIEKIKLLLETDDEPKWYKYYG